MLFRSGKLPISIPAGVTVTLKDNVVTVKGPKGELSQFVDPSINVAVEDGHVVLTENENAMLDNTKQRHAFHGLYRSLVNNMVVGVSEGYKKELELVGVGYRASNNGNIIDFALGYTRETSKSITVTYTTATGVIKFAGLPEKLGVKEKIVIKYTLETKNAEYVSTNPRTLTVMQIFL